MISNMCPGHEFRDEKIFYFVSAKKWHFAGLYSIIYVTYFVFFKFWNKKAVSPRKLSTHTWNMRTYPDIFISEFFHISKMHFQLGFTCTQVQTGLFPKCSTTPVVGPSHVRALQEKIRWARTDVSRLVGKDQGS
jgi:hypothetical protein